MASGSTRERGAGERVRPHRVRVGRARPALLPGDAGGWTRSCSPTSWSSTTSSASSDYDLWIGDEAWELDYYLHENPEQKRAAYVWLTDFVGWLPMEDGGGHESLPHRRLQRGDDRAHRALPARARPSACSSATATTWCGSPSGRPAHDRRLDRGALRLRRLRDRLRPEPSSRIAPLARSSAIGDDERVCLVTVGGSGVGAHLLRRVIDAFPEAKQRVPDLRMVVVCGSAHRPARPAERHAGLEVVTYVHDLYRHLAACDLAIVQGGLTTVDGADRGPATLPLLPAPPPLRAELPRPPPARALRGRAAHGLRKSTARPRSPPRSPRRSAATWTTGRSRRTERRAQRR